MPAALSGYMRGVSGTDQDWERLRRMGLRAVVVWAVLGVVAWGLLLGLGLSGLDLGEGRFVDRLAAIGTAPLPSMIRLGCAVLTGVFAWLGQRRDGALWAWAILELVAGVVLGAHPVWIGFGLAIPLGFLFMDRLPPFPQLSDRWAAPIVLGALGLLAVGHWHFWFLCDDAYIAFRYVSNAMLGHGYVWNAPPFVPVEGYTSFGWVVLMHGLWKLTGLDPTVTANPVSLGCAAVATLLVARWVWRLPLTTLAPHRVGVLGLVLLGILLDRSWTTWSSSGLETALFDLLLLGWLGSAWNRRWPLAWLLVALILLVRPDGMLFVLGTVAAHALAIRERRPSWTDAIGPLALVLPGAHLLWRHATYGAWVPNTYVAKHVGIWPEAGLAYLGSFLAETWLWVPLAVCIGVASRPRLSDRWMLGATMAAHTAYYTLSVGGDHFEYRVLLHLVPLGWIGLAWGLDRWLSRPTPAMWALAAVVLLSVPLQWTHRAASLQKHTREDTRKMVTEVSPFAGAWAGSVTGSFDLLQHYLQFRHINTRHREHVVFVEGVADRYPTRDEGMALEAGENPVHAMFSVGIPGWTLPKVAIIDKLGLNDRVVARNPVHARFRTMAHDRRPPKGYVGCFKPNVTTAGGRAIVRTRPLSDDRVRACERRFFEQVSR